MKTATDTTPRVWIGCLACYNAGRLVGDWFDGLEAGDVTTQQVHETDPRAILYASHEELWVMDHEGYGTFLREEVSPAEAQHLAEVIEECDDPDALGAYLDLVGDLESALETFEEAYAGEWESEEDYAAELADDVYGVEAAALSDGILGRYFDYAAFARDLFMSDYASAPAPGFKVYVFRMDV